MLTEICQYLRNWFDYDAAHNRLPSWSGTYEIIGGEIPELEGRLIYGQYYRIIGSVLNDGVHQFPADDLQDETFTGTIQSMAIPRALVNLVDDISAWREKNYKRLNSPYQSESWDGYSYTLKSSGDASGGGGLTWQSQFAAQLAPWRKI